jgi:hypothetical protein
MTAEQPTPNSTLQKLVIRNINEKPRRNSRQARRKSTGGTNYRARSPSPEPLSPKSTCPKPTNARSMSARIDRPKSSSSQDDKPFSSAPATIFVPPKKPKADNDGKKKENAKLLPRSGLWNIIESYTESPKTYKPGGFHPVELGHIINGYRIIRKLGFGSYATVWLAKAVR